MQLLEENKLSWEEVRHFSGHMRKEKSKLLENP